MREVGGGVGWEGRPAATMAMVIVMIVSNVLSNHENSMKVLADAGQVGSKNNRIIGRDFFY